MASNATHTEPSRPHTKDELLKPGHDSHVANLTCPDPSAHRDTKLQEQASTAALYVTSPQRNRDSNLLDANNKLSSRSAAMSLKYARPEDLPSYPVLGIDASSSASAAANLANTNQKPFEHWKPDASASASKAAMLAKDYKMAPMWQPELSAAGSKAALLAHRDGPKLNLWHPEASAEGNSAANLAMRQKHLSPQLDYGYTDDGHKRALMAATGALDRSRSAASTPPSAVHPAYPDSANSATNALNAATVAHKPSMKKPNVDSDRINSDAMRAARVQNIGANVDRQIFTEHPTFNSDIEEKKHQAALRASAVSMAKQMYEQTEKKRRAAEAAELSGAMGSSAANAVHARNAASVSASTTPDIKTQALQYIHLQEAAQKLAQERLAKLDPDGVARYREHYGYSPDPPRSRMSLRGRARRRADSESTAPQHADDSSDDEFTSRRIRKQMSGLNNSVAEVDARKRAQDRASLLAAAERKVQAQMHTMDEKVFQDTGKVSPAMMEQWETKARARAAADSENRQRNFGKVNIGGGRFMDQSELDAIAQARLQPTLNEIGDTAEKKRAADEERRLDDEQKKRTIMSEKEKEREVKAEQKRLRAEEKAAAKAHRAEEKAADKARKAEEKAAKKEEQRRFKEAQKDAAKGAAVSSAHHEELQRELEHGGTTTTSIIGGAEVAPETASTTSPETARNDATETDAEARPDPDRHVSHVLNSSSEASSISSDDHTADESEEEEAVATTDDHTAARAIAERATTPAVADESAAATTTVTTGPESELAHSSTAAEERPKSRGLGGFFGKFKRRSQAPGTFVSGGEGLPMTEELTPITIAPREEETHHHEPGTETTGSAAAAVTSPALSASSFNRRSSFQRHEEDLHSLSSLSSSDLEEGEETARGRARRSSVKKSRGFLSKLTGRGGNTDTTDATTTSAHAGEKPNVVGFGAMGKGTSADEDDDDEDVDEFEEARDHFDEGAVAAPVAGGHADGVVAGRSGISPSGRETKFVEEL